MSLLRSSGTLRFLRGNYVPSLQRVQLCRVLGTTSLRSFSHTRPVAQKVQSRSPLAPIGVEAALHADQNPSFVPKPTIFKEFTLTNRVAIVSGGNRGIGLEMALTLCEAGAIVYCLDLPPQPGMEWNATKRYVDRMNVEGARLEYRSVDVTKQGDVWAVTDQIAAKEGRMDVCIAAAGILHEKNCLEYTAEEFQKVMDVNVNGVLYTAQAAGRHMVRFGSPGSIILIASISGNGANKGHPWVAYNTSKSAVLQMGRSMACELGAKGIRVNTISPGYIYTSMTAAFLKERPHLLDVWSSHNPLGRIGHPDELRGVTAWLASDASTFCTGSDILVSGGHHSW